jgi:hypothetical protein
MIDRIVSGAQTGADRAALDVALALGIDCGGWVPQGRVAEDGIIPAHYPNLWETQTADPECRTECNVRDSDATLIFSHNALLGGSEYTVQKAQEHGKPCLHIDFGQLSIAAAVSEIGAWIALLQPAVLNIAGPRASDDPLIYAKTRQVLEELLSS